MVELDSPSRPIDLITVAEQIANVRKLAGVLAVDLGFNDNLCLALVKREAVRVG